MRKVYRYTDNSNYWNERWESSGVDISGFKSTNFYPIKQAEELLKDYTDTQTILELGCGAGRLYFHYKNKKYNIKGIEYSQVAVNNIKNVIDNKDDVIQGNVLNLPYDKYSFDYIIAFGLFHNLEDVNDVQKAFDETARVLKKKGTLLFSVRYDSFENNLIEKIIKSRNKEKKFNKFHRLHFDLESTIEILRKAGFKIKNIQYERNVSFLFKYDFFRTKNMKDKIFVESKARSEGFKLNKLGEIIDNFLHKYFSKHFSNLLIVTVEKE